jgi:bisphosphoglycerate-independent phosphoglycerate mutase (AlkP superfamily)
MSGLFKDTKEAFSIALELKNKGWKYGDVADHLNAKGFKNQHGNAWDKHTVSRLMVAHNVRRKKPRDKTRVTLIQETIIQPAPHNHIETLRSVRCILKMTNLPIQVRGDMCLTLLEGVQ